MHLNCRRRLNKTNANASRVSGRCQLPVVQGHDAHGFSGGQAFGHDEQILRHNKDQEPEVFFSAIVGVRRKHRYAQNPKRFSLVFGEW